MIITLLSAAASALSVLSFTFLLSKGRKRILLIGILGTVLTNSPFIILSAGYPFVSRNHQLPLNPESVIKALMISLILSSLLGPDDLPLLGCRALLNDNSSTCTRTRNLNVSEHFRLR